MNKIVGIVGLLFVLTSVHSEPANARAKVACDCSGGGSSMGCFVFFGLIQVADSNCPGTRSQWDSKCKEICAMNARTAGASNSMADYQVLTREELLQIKSKSKK